MKNKNSVTKCAISKKANLLIKPAGIKWHEILAGDKWESVKPCTSNATKELKLIGQDLLEKDVQQYKKFLHVRKERVDFNWIQTVLRSGTLADKMAAHTVLIQDSPVHNLASIDALIAMVKIKGKRECLMATDTLKDLFLSDLLQEDRKLNSFEMHPLDKLNELCSGNTEVKNRRLLLWYFEDQLKQNYESFVKAVEKVSHDTVETTKQKALAVMTHLLKFHPEQEQFLLVSLVNKMGDPLKRIAAKVVSHMNEVVDSHPNMKGVIIDEMERFLYRPNVGARAQYYVLCFLSRIVFSHEDKKVATHLIGIYFGFFKLCIKKSEVDSKMMSAILTGVSRAFPYIDHNKCSLLEDHVDSLYKVIHMVKFTIRVQALMLILQVLNMNDGPTDRFYATLYRLISSTEVCSSSNQAVFLNLLYCALKKDPIDRRVKAFVKRLLQMCLYYSSAVACGTLFLIAKIIQMKPNITHVDNKAGLFEESDNEEHYEDVPLENEENNENITPKTKAAPKNQTSKPSWVHMTNLNRNTNIGNGSYDPLHRNPIYCGAENEAIWELALLSRHFHPSVVMFAKNCVDGTDPDYSGDPLQDFTIIHFLDRFVYRNPKNPTAKLSETVIKQNSIFGRRSLYVPKGSRGLSVTSEAYLNQKKEQVAVEEQFLHQYLSQRAARKGGKKHKDDDSDIESVASDEFERMLDKMEPGKAERIDFAGGVHKTKKKGAKKTMQEESEDDQLAESFEEDDDDEEFQFGSDEDFQEAFREFDEDIKDVDTGFQFDGEDLSTKKRKNMSNSSMKPNKVKRIDSETLFASAEQFSSLLDEHLGSKLDTTTAQAMANKDNADAKQLAWEAARNKWVQGTDWKTQKRERNKKIAKRFKKSKGRNKHQSAMTKKRFKR